MGIDNYEEEDGVVEITIGSSLDDFEAKEDANDQAWQHAIELAKSVNISLASEEFEEVYRELSLRYEHQTEHLKFFLMTAMLTIRELLETDTLSLSHDGDKITEEEILTKIGAAARKLVASYVWLAAGYELTWPTNDELPDEIKLSFYFNPEDIEEEDIWD